MKKKQTPAEELNIPLRERTVITVELPKYMQLLLKYDAKRHKETISRNVEELVKGKFLELFDFEFLFAIEDEHPGFLKAAMYMADESFEPEWEDDDRLSQYRWVMKKYREDRWHQSSKEHNRVLHGEAAGIGGAQ